MQSVAGGDYGRDGCLLPHTCGTAVAFSGFRSCEGREDFMAKRLYDALKDCKKDEVKVSFCSFFKMKINALRATFVI